jgi:hypothetical protein
MARQTSLSVESLVALGVGKLAHLVLNGVERDPAFKKVVAAALAGTKGPKAVAALLDRRLAGLERARGYVEWDKVKSFAADLDATLTTIVDELGAADPALAADRLLRFIATSSSVFERADDSQGRVQGIYEAAVEGLGGLSGKMAGDDRNRLPDLIMASIGRDEYGYLPRLVEAVAPTLGEEALAAWDRRLAEGQSAPSRAKAGVQDWAALSHRSGRVAARQVIAQARGDLDGFIALEETKHPNLQNAIGVAQLLLEAGRPSEALTWVRREGRRSIKFMTSADLADGGMPRDADSRPRAKLEARILDALGDGAAAQALRWTAFETSLDGALLRDHIDHLGEFEEFDTLDRAFDHVSSAKDSYRALDFFVGWPQFNRAAALVFERRDIWDGRQYHILFPAAEALEADHPIAATILYRAMLGDILARAQSSAYGHGARHLAKLDQIAAAFDAASTLDLPSHALFREELVKKHGRKAGFWSLVRAKG